MHTSLNRPRKHRKINATSLYLPSQSGELLADSSRFYCADERKANRSPAFIVDGPAHGELYTGVVEGGLQGPWQQTFVKGIGYKEFSQPPDERM